MSCCFGEGERQGGRGGDRESKRGEGERERERDALWIHGQMSMAGAVLA